MGIPRYVPVISSDNGNYPAGGDSWAATPKRVEPSGAEQLAGAIPNQPLDAQTYNWLLGTLGEHVDAIIDAPMFTAEPRAIFQNGELNSRAPWPAPLNDNSITDPVIVYPAGHTLLLKTGNASSGKQFNYTHPTAGLKYLNDADTVVWIPGGDAGFTGASGSAGQAILAARRDNGQILAILPTGSEGTAGIARYTNNFGASWSAGGSFAVTGAIYTAAFFDTKWWVPHYNVTNCQMFVSDSGTAPTAWSNAATLTSVGYSQLIPRRMVVGNTVSLALGELDLQVGRYVHNGAGTGAWSLLALAASDSTKNGWRGAYNPNTDKFLLGNDDGQVWLLDGAATGGTLLETFGNQIKDIAAIGRGFAIAQKSGGSHWVDYYAQSTTQAWYRRRILTPRDTNDIGLHLTRWQGRLIISRIVDPGAEVARLQQWWTDPHPADAVFDFAVQGS
jgi:hypothetical protein